MKKIALIALSTLIITSCSDENTPAQPNEGNAIALSVSGPVVLSRTVTAENAGTITTSFVAGDEIGVTASGGATAVNVKHTVDADGSSLTGESPIAFELNIDAQINAYSPYVAEATASGVDFSVNADQTDATNFNNSNFLTAKATVSKDLPQASLSFTPRTALVYVEMAGELGTKTTGLSLCGMQPGITWNMASDAVTTTGTAVDVNMYKPSEAPVFMAFIPAQTSAATTPLFVIDVDGSEYVYTPSGDIDFKSNTVKRFKLTVNNDKTIYIESSVVDGTDWTEEGNEVVNEEDDITRRFIEIVSAEDGNFLGKEISTVTGLGSTKAGWNAVIVNDNATIAIEGDEAVLTTNSGSWYQRALYFRGLEGKGSKHKYQLDFEVKGGTDIQVAVIRNQGNGVTGNQWFSIGGTTGQKVEKTTEEYTHKTLIVDLSQIAAGYDIDFSTGVGIILNAKDNTPGQVHYFRNVSMKEIE